MTFAEQVKASVEISNVIGEYVRLRKAGPNRLSGLCPFHTEKSPSFSVNTLHQFFKCFGCGKGGDVLTFVMEIEGVSFWEALKSLAERNGIPVPRRAEQSDPDTKLRAAVYQMHEMAEQSFRAHLKSSAGSEARAYVVKRGLSAESVELFGVGYADRSGRQLVKSFEQNGFTAEQMEKSGLILRRDDGSLYDRFRNRLMFPIHSETGKVIAFGGRALDANDPAKYMNSSETGIYRKSAVLYNLNRARQGIRKADRVVLVEGYMDVIGVFSAGITEVVATCGTALTGDQVRAMRRHSGRIIVNFDPDNAGASAAERSVNLLLDESMHIRILALDGGLDPDAYCKERGAEAYRAKLESSKGYFYWMADRARGKFDMRSADGRIEGFKYLLPAIQKVPDKLERLAVVNDVAGYLGVASGVVLENFRRAAVDRREVKLETPKQTLRPDEKILLNLLLTDAAACTELIPQMQEICALEQFASRPVFLAIFALHASESAINFNAVNDRLEEKDRALLAHSVLKNDNEEGTLEHGRACVATLRHADVAAQAAELRSRLRKSEREGDMQEALRITGELSQLLKR